jgi:hypothetical protein
MDEIENWFENEFSPFGFNLTPTIYDVNTFTPMRGVMYTYSDDYWDSRTVKLRTRIGPELIQDMSMYGLSQNDIINEIRCVLRSELIREVELFGLPNPFGDTLIDFTPKKKITKFKFND